MTDNISVSWGFCGNNEGNNIQVDVGSLSLYFSYKTVVAFSTPKTGLVCRQNDWSTTTGKHLNAIQPNHKKRVSGAEFEKQLAAVLAGYGLEASA